MPALEVMLRAQLRRRRAMCERAASSRTMLVDTEVMTAELEMVVDPAVGGEKAPRMTC
jgi:hypothetical protein